MDFAPLLTAQSPIPLHAIAAFAAMGLGGVQLVMKKGTKQHRIIGWVWVLLMAAVALSSFFIHELKMFGLFSPIHALSVFTLWSLYMAVTAARAHQIKRHKFFMASLYVFALLLTGAFTLTPGRIMYQVIFGA